MPLSEREKAEALGCSTRQVRRLQKEILAEIGTATARLETFRGLLAERLPIPRRVELLKRLAEQREHLPTALKALEQANRIDGLLQPEPEQPQEHQPIFALPPGTVMRLALEATPVTDKGESQETAKALPPQQTD